MEKIKQAYLGKTFQLEQYKLEMQNWTDSTIICGIDEVGRGCLFGPVVACCAVLKPFSSHPLLQDSKILTENQRLEAVKWLKSNSWYAFGIINHRTIDEINILQATKLAMKKAYYGIVTQLNKHPETVALDAVHLQFTPEQKIYALTKGESKSVSIAAASLLAKVYRDEIVARFDAQFPGYNFKSNKGYGAKVHTDKIKNDGESLLHRASFLSSLKKDKEKSNETNQQTSLFC